MTRSSIGQITTRGDVADAVIATLNKWFLTFLPDVERQHGIIPLSPRPPAPESIHGGIDFLAWRKDLTPEIIVVAQPFEDSELHTDQFDQAYELQIAAVIVGEDETSVTTLADLYGAAIMATIADNGDLGGFAERTKLIVAPRTEFENPDVRTVQRSVCVFRTWVQDVVGETTRPPAPVPDGQIPPAVPTATSTTFTLTVDPVDQPL